MDTSKYRIKLTVDLGLGIFNPIKIGEKMQKGFIRDFDRTGESIHSSRMDTIGYLIHHCEQNKIPYLVTIVQGMGYIKRLI